MAIQWRQYDVTIQIRDRMIGGIPIVPDGADRADAYEGWARGQGVEQTDAHELAEALADDPDMPVTVEQVEGLATGFRCDDDGLYIEARQVKAMIREAMQRLGFIKRIRGSRQVVQHDIHVRAVDGTQKIRLDRAIPDGTDTRPISVVTRQGPRTAIKKFDYVTQVEMSFRVRVLAGGVAEERGTPLVGAEQLRDVFDLGGELGLGADRSQGEGTFDLISFEEADDLMLPGPTGT